MIEKVIDIKIKKNLESFLKITKIDFKYLKNYKLAKKDKEKANKDD